MKIKLRILSSVAVFSFLFYSCEKDGNEIPAVETGAESTQIVGADQAIPGEYIVVYKEDNSLSGKSANMKTKSQQILSKYAIAESNLKQIYSKAIQGFAVKGLSEKQVEVLKNSPEVAYVERNYIRKLRYKKGKPASSLPATVSNKMATNNTRLSNGEFLPWGINRVGREDGSGRTCWIIDTGIAPHSDLNIDTNRSRSFVGGSWQDEDGHGTHVAGTVAARNNGSGVIGVAYGATLVAVRIFDAQGNTTDAAALGGIDYVANNARNGDTWNYSVGFEERTISQADEDAFRNLERTTFGAVAAGNNNDDTRFYSPERLRTRNSWVVGNMNRQENPEFDSNFGSSVDRWAPGNQIWSTWLNGQFRRIRGTSNRWICK